MLNVENISKSYETSEVRTHALSDVSLTIGAGEFVVVGLASGFYPAFILASLRPSAALGGDPSGPTAPVWIGRAMVVVQFATLAALLVAAITVYRQTNFAVDSALGAGRGSVLTMTTRCRSGLPQAARELPGVRGASCSAQGAFNLAPQGAVTAINSEGRRFTPGFVDVDPHFFALAGLQPLAGRVFSPDRGGNAARRELVVNQTAARPSASGRRRRRSASRSRSRCRSGPIRPPNPM